MGFHQVPAKPFFRKRPPNTVRVRLRRVDQGRARRLEILITREVADRLGWRLGDRVLIAFGRNDPDGRDRGRVRLTRTSAIDSSLKLLRANRSTSLRTGTNRVPEEFHDLPLGAGDAEFEVAGDVLFLGLPFAAFDAPRLQGDNGGMDKRGRIKRWIEGVLAEEGCSAEAWARKAGIAPSTLTRFNSRDDAPLLSSTTLAKMERAVPGFRIAPSI